MNILFIHRSFPAQFKYLATTLPLLNPNNKVVFLAEEDANDISGIEKVIYRAKSKVQTNNQFLLNYEFALFQGLGVVEQALKLKESGFVPDVIYGFSGWGSSMFIKDVFPEVPFVCYCEWFANPQGAKYDFARSALDVNERVALRCNNVSVLATLSMSDYCIAPTNWQKQQFPKDFHHKIQVVHDAVDAGRLKPDNDVKFVIKDKNLEFTTKDEVITYGTRGFEPCRGFPEFMEMVSVMLKKRPNAHFIIAGDDTVHYSENKKCSYKKLMLDKFDFDMNRVHFVGTLPFEEYLKFLQVSSVHVYLTYPFVLSWSVLEAMSCGCCIVGSNTSPVLDVIKDNYNGLLTDFFDVNMLVDKVEYALENKEKMNELRQNARNLILEEYDLVKVLPQQIQFLNNVIMSSKK